ncbi:phage portal protein [Pseudorhodoplanes sinuspersici]|uniref:Phage portal protein n=1 Tax=Pseudorhodoplanes sinuspersici TaxID=1235591 RepID=A0A1W6ZX51_9HYPH|nr:phage portal protein [Pseudorhodoplanes sinuspersici]ARQ01893.1 phage portal protein [Pseudorhodoplanes sinuspersici]RKE73658.1 HK97 family phage portal protein [Pseudorhodoplanes sinuspersici]
MALRWPWSQKSADVPRNAVQDSGGGVLITTSAELEQFLKDGQTTKAGPVVTAETAMREGPVYACVRILSGPPATLPLSIKRRLDARTREDASDTDLWKLWNRRPNRWQKPHQFKRMLMAHVLLRGNAVCLKVVSRGALKELIPLHPDRVEIKQKDDLSLSFEYTRKNGGKSFFTQDEIFHLYGLTLNGYSGVTPITYARETIGLALAQENYGASQFKNGMRASGVLTHPQKLGEESRKNIKASLDEYRAGGESEGKFLLLEEGMTQSQLKMTAQDTQWVESRKLSVRDIAMFFGVPPSMIGDNSGSDSNWGTGLEQKANGFVTFTLEDYLTMFEEGITIDLNSDPAIYAKYNRAALVKGDIKARWDAYVKGLQWGVYSPNEVRALEDQNPRKGGDIYYPPPNTAGGSNPDSETGEAGNDDPKTA